MPYLPHQRHTAMAFVDNGVISLIFKAAGRSKQVFCARGVIEVSDSSPTLVGLSSLGSSRGKVFVRGCYETRWMNDIWLFTAGGISGRSRSVASQPTFFQHDVCMRRISWTMPSVDCFPRPLARRASGLIDSRGGAVNNAAILSSKTCSTTVAATHQVTS